MNFSHLNIIYLNQAKLSLCFWNNLIFYNQFIRLISILRGGSTIAFGVVWHSINTILIFLIFIAFHQCNLNWAKLCTKLKWENIQHCASSVWHDTLEQKKNDLWGWGKQQQIRGLLCYYLPQGLLPQSRGTRLKRARPWFPPDMHIWTLLYDILSHSAQCKDMFLV